jgi:hypothetical protein
VALSLKNMQGILIKQPEGQIVHRWEAGALPIAFSPTASLVAFVDTAGMIRLMDTNSTTELTRLDLLKEPVTAITFSALIFVSAK